MNAVLSIIIRRWRELLGFALLFRFVESLLFAPMVALAGKLLLGRTVLDSTALVSFLLSPRGFLALTLAAVTALSIRLTEHAGLSAIIFGAFEGRRIRKPDDRAELPARLREQPDPASPEEHRR